MMTGFAIKGWCPDAWHPMMAGDGLLVRIRPRLARLSRTQVLGLCAAAIEHGNGAIDMTSRANLQIRGVTKARWPALVEALVALGLADPDRAREARANILVAPGWLAGDDTHRIACALAARLDELPELPGKVGFGIDAGAAPVLSDDPGDFRIERGEHGGLILRADGRETGIAVEPGEEADALIAIARWFVSSGGAAAGRMARHRAALPDGIAGTIRPARAAARLEPGQYFMGLVPGLASGAPFGRMEAPALANFIDETSCPYIRVTPWRIIIFEDIEVRDAGGFAAERDVLTIRADACVGAPACPQSTVKTRALARRLAPHVRGGLHVSGCAKGCARARGADIVLTGRDGRYDLVIAGRAGDLPVRAGLDVDQVLAHFGAA